MSGRMTAEQQAQAVRLLPLANRIAAKLRVDEDVAALALCQAVIDYQPDRGVSLVKWCRTRVYQRCLDYIDSEESRRRRERRCARRNKTWDMLPLCFADDSE